MKVNVLCAIILAGGYFVAGAWWWLHEGATKIFNKPGGAPVYIGLIAIALVCAGIGFLFYRVTKAK